MLSFTTTESEYCVARLAADAKPTESSRVTRKAIISALKEPHILNLFAITFCNGIILGGVGYFTPSIVQALGFNTTNTQLLTVPPYVLAFILTMIAATFADRYSRRGLAALCSLTFCLVGLILNLSGTTIAIRYASICLLVGGIYATAPCILTWVPNNSAMFAKRATAIAMIFVASNLGGMIATWLYPTSTAPRYLLATTVDISLLCVEMVLIVVQVVMLWRLNRKKIAKREQILCGVEHLSLDDQMEILGDHHPDYKYTL